MGIVEFLFIWLGTVIFSFIAEMANEFRLFKDVANNGYKINMEKFSEFSKLINPDAAKNLTLSLLTPIKNIFDVTQRAVKYNNIEQQKLLDELDVLDCLIPMTEDEIKDFQQKPTSLNAFIITIKSDYQKKNSLTIQIEEEEGISRITYELDSKGNLVVLDAEGPIAKLSKEEQIQKVINGLNKMAVDAAKAVTSPVVVEETPDELSSQTTSERLIKLRDERDYLTNSGLGDVHKRPKRK